MSLHRRRLPSMAPKGEGKVPQATRHRTVVVVVVVFLHNVPLHLRRLLNILCTDCHAPVTWAMAAGSNGNIKVPNPLLSMAAGEESRQNPLSQLTKHMRGQAIRVRGLPRPAHPRECGLRHRHSNSSNNRVILGCVTNGDPLCMDHNSNSNNSSSSSSSRLLLHLNTRCKDAMAHLLQGDPT
jgi:hypothetical protein